MHRPKSDQEKVTRSVVETIGFTRKEAEAWKLPPFQRKLTVNARVRACAEQIKEDGGVLPGTITFGRLAGEEYLIDGMHRRESFLLSECAEGYADARTCFFNTMAEMAAEFVELNTSLVKMRPDDLLRGLEAQYPSLCKIAKECPWVGYDQVRRNERSPIVSMSTVLRSWERSRAEVPSSSSPAAVQIVESMSDDEVRDLLRFLKLAIAGWGKDAEYQRLWSGLNLCLCMWLFRRVVLQTHSTRHVRLTDAEFGRTLPALSADQNYLDWLVGRNTGDRDRSPGYSRITITLGKRLTEITGKKTIWPRPDWARGNRLRG
jgi:hypothetical protein